ncbi:MAG: phosphatidate cytidylyltransferase [Paracoccaceae bacterium]|nr:phosphatidate cytidylyltransferase [Paracoccaceae bacterium]MDG1736864.1 phosphatidate cytidylyltransferase [Paracoccaceae bacterium]MDG2259164.1 phosphatidate cytidylyltransferase [Paracoccaceae bacterium]
MSASNWSDLGPRIISGLVLAGVGLVSVMFGGMVFSLFVAVCCGLMIWELGQLSSRYGILAYPLAALAMFGIFFGFGKGWLFYILLIGILPAITAVVATKQHWRVFAFAAMIGTTGLVLQLLRIELGLAWLLWLVLVVVATDIAGYFAGRLIGGPKFWPSLSPKKTWSGTVAGWIASGFVGFLFGAAFAGPFILFSIAVSVASQMGDIAESALKRRFEVKDSSNLIPGHGGFLDRFDGMIAAALVIGVVSLVLPDGLMIFRLGEE